MCLLTYFTPVMGRGFEPELPTPLCLWLGRYGEVDGRHDLDHRRAGVAEFHVPYTINHFLKTTKVFSAPQASPHPYRIGRGSVV